MAGELPGLQAPADSPVVEHGAVADESAGEDAARPCSRESDGSAAVDCRRQPPGAVQSVGPWLVRVRRERQRHACQQKQCLHSAKKHTPVSNTIVI